MTNRCGPCLRLDREIYESVAFHKETSQRRTSAMFRVVTMPMKDAQNGQALTRARRREQGMRAMEAFFFERELQTLDAIKTRLNLTSRSEVLRMMIAKTDPDSFTPADAAVLKKDAA